MGIRKALPDDAYEYAWCHISSWKSAYKNIVPDKYLNKLSVEKRTERLENNLKKTKRIPVFQRRS